MLGLMLGTVEGREILSLLNKFTDDILISTATNYGGELLNGFNYKYKNSSPLEKEELKELFFKHNVTTLVDASHPYASLVTKNCKDICAELNIKYLRYERASVCEKYRGNRLVTFISGYSELIESIYNDSKLNNDKSVILNTTGSNNIEKFCHSNLKVRIVHRVLPSVKVIEKCFKLGVKTENIVAVKGPIGYELNVGFIKQFNAKAIVLKDSGIQGGTIEKIEAALDSKIKIFIIERNSSSDANAFNNVSKLVKYIEDKKLY
ncbi:MAG: cobalt-precorrin-6A reductase [Clostridium sp.]|nr:cobalt-precorrin-6A reductase [Clostridium sp.]